MSQLSRFIGVAVLVWLAQGQAQPQQPPRFRTETNFVRVDVYATKGGVAVQDLSEQDFEVYEDNAPQKIESFEHIVINPAGPQAGLIEPSSPSQANQLAADPRRRVFVVFLDTHSVPLEGSHAIREPMISLLQRVLGDDDLVALMTPDMSADQLTFGRRTQVIEQGLRETWFWGRRDTIMLDEWERKITDCFPPLPGEPGPESALATALIKRRRERVTLDSLRDLVRHMGALREGRTAVITVSDGWLLYRPDRALSLLEPRKTPGGQNADPLPGSPTPIGVGRGGTLTKEPRNETYPNDRTSCDAERADLAFTDDDQYFKMIYGEANRANVSFYTIDPRGLEVFDTPIYEAVPLQMDKAMLDRRQDVLRTLAGATDGLALFNSNDLRKQLNRIADDLTSYYLLGYRSTNSKLDGQFRAIKVRSKRPGIEIRARHGYTAATAEEVARARAAADPPADAAKVALVKALGTIEPDARASGRPTLRGPGEPMVFHRGPSTGNQVQPSPGRVFPRSDRVRLELEAAAGSPGWSGALLDRNGNRTAIPVATAERTDAATGQRWLTADITLAPLGAGDYVVELTVGSGAEVKKTLVGIRVTQ